MNILFGAMLLIHFGGNDTYYQGDVTAFNIDGNNGGIAMEVSTFGTMTTEDIFADGFDAHYGQWTIELHSPVVNATLTCYPSVSIGDGIIDLDCVQ